jgi:hypothetical protein
MQTKIESLHPEEGRGEGDGQVDASKPGITAKYKTFSTL